MSYPHAVRGAWLRRCCRNEIHRHASRTNYLIPAEGFELECHDCLDRLRWSVGAWEHVPSRIEREASPDVTAARHIEADRVTHGKFSQLLAKLKRQL